MQLQDRRQVGENVERHRRNSNSWGAGLPAPRGFGSLLPQGRGTVRAFLRKQRIRYVTRTRPHAALREMRAHLGHPATLVSLLAVIAVLVLTGPFGTLDSLRAAPRAGYWGAVVVTTYATGAFVDIVVGPRLDRLGRALRIGLLAGMSGLAITAVVTVINLALLGNVPGGPGALGTLATIFAIAAIASGALRAAGEFQATTPATATTGAKARPALLDRLPVDKRGPLVSLSVEDHYVRVRTTRGEEMVLMRLVDAIREAAPVDGLRVHRSHWVARDAVRAVRREGDRAVLQMTSGGDIPASRSHIPALREAGLLPR
jgi:DNA-binding LytR/AlgR family response regulator